MWSLSAGDSFWQPRFEGLSDKHLDIRSSAGGLVFMAQLAASEGCARLFQTIGGKNFELGHSAFSIVVAVQDMVDVRLHQRPLSHAGEHFRICKNAVSCSIQEQATLHLTSRFSMMRKQHKKTTRLVKAVERALSQGGRHTQVVDLQQRRSGQTSEQ